MRFVVLLIVLVGLAACGGGPPGLECAPYARELTGLRLYGDAAAWWEQAAGLYPRSSAPEPGAVLVFRRSARLPAGHVSVVRAVVSSREIRVDQANWVDGRVTGNDPVIDVSDANDWSAVRVWWQPAGAIGSTTYPSYGFVGP